jgi:hypothetical protein
LFILQQKSVRKKQLKTHLNFGIFVKRKRGVGQREQVGLHLPGGHLLQEELDALQQQETDLELLVFS